MPKRIKGCVHIIVKNKKIVNIFTHLNKFPDKGVIHLMADKIYTNGEFKKEHPKDHDELKRHKNKINIFKY